MAYIYEVHKHSMHPPDCRGRGGLEVKRWVWGLILGSQGGASGLPIRITKGGGLTTSLIIDTQYLFLWHIQM